MADRIERKRRVQKLTWPEVIAIRKDFVDKVLREEIMAKYSVSRQTVWLIGTNRAWKEDF